MSEELAVPTKSRAFDHNGWALRVRERSDGDNVKLINNISRDRVYGRLRHALRGWSHTVEGKMGFARFSQKKGGEVMT